MRQFRDGKKSGANSNWKFCLERLARRRVLVKSTAKKQKLSSKAAPEVVKEGDYAPGEDERLNSIATAAYYKAEARGFVPGMEMDDWLDAETEIDACEGH